MVERPEVHEDLDGIPATVAPRIGFDDVVVDLNELVRLRQPPTLILIPTFWGTPIPIRRYQLCPPANLSARRMAVSAA